MDANNNSCALEPTLDTPAIQTPEAPPPEEEEVATQRTRDIRPMSSGIINIKQEIMRLADHGIYAIPVNISTDADGKKLTPSVTIVLG
jgi:hypothetical protein